ncbi:MAG TPA: PASTA domain-containing protein [Gaiellaceae bacterium]|nr:PASTA domain-containing protein [Gaiellaceae bacterium]
MTAGVIGRLPRVALIACAIGLVSATITFAASSTLSSPTAPAATPEVVAPEPLVVPDVRKQAYVFAKGSLEQEGFAWRVEGAVPGYAANVVVSQTPAPGAEVVPDGAPIVVLRLSRNPAYKQEGTPENVAPYPGKPARLVGAAKPPAKKPAKAIAAAAAPKPAASAKKPAAKPTARKPAFAVAGAPKEPADEILLSARAKQLAAWVEAHPRPTSANVNHWLYQHNWIVTGARFGWAEGAAALRTLVAVDARVQELWGVGGKSAQVARSALAEVEARSG